jgi:hypothetical protein
VSGEFAAHTIVTTEIASQDNTDKAFYAALSDAVQSFHWQQALKQVTSMDNWGRLQLRAR